MIINISGTSGSGKSMIARQIMALYTRVEPLMAPPRKRPAGYTCFRRNGKKLFVLGHYETDCGGCDTLANYFGDEGMLTGIYNWVRAAHGPNTDVVYEGLIVESDVRRCAKLYEDGFPLVVLSIDISLEDCLQSVRDRREAKGNFKELNPKNTKAKFTQARRKRERLLEAGVDCRFQNRDESVKLAMLLLGFLGVQNIPEIKVKPRPQVKPQVTFEEYYRG